MTLNIISKLGGYDRKKIQCISEKYKKNTNYKSLLYKDLQAIA